MRVAINLHQYYYGRIGGQENYVVNVIRRLGLAGHRLSLWAPASEHAAVAGFAPGAEIVDAGANPGAEILSRCRRGDFDLLFCPLLVLDPLDVPIPSAVVMPDVQHEYYPQYFGPAVLAWRRRNFLPSAANASVVLVPSEFTRRTVVERFGIPGEKIVAFPYGISDDFLAAPDEAGRAGFAALGLEEPYIYFPANYWPHKNHSNLLRALDLLRQGRHANLRLLLSGAASPDRDRVAAEIAALGLGDAVRLLDYQPRAVVLELYRHARALAFATQFEGLGLPVLEAMSQGVPVVTSCGGASAEVAGELAVLVDPEDPASIAAGLARVLEDDSLRARLTAGGREHARGFNWERYMVVLDGVLERITAPGFERLGPIELQEYPPISVVTPSLNMARFLGETIESVLSQGYPKLDYVVMDGGSNDGTRELLESYGARVRWRSEPDLGQSHAIDKGFRATSGAVFGYLNADDAYLPGALTAVGTAFRRNPRAGMVYGEANHVDEQGNVLCRYQTLEFDYATLGEQCYLCQPATFVSRTAYEQAGGIDLALGCAMDYDLWVRIATENQVLKLPDYLANWRMYRGIKSLALRRQAIDEAIGVARKYFGYAPFNYVNGRAQHMLNGLDQFFDLAEERAAGAAAVALPGTAAEPGAAPAVSRRLGQPRRDCAGRLQAVGKTAGYRGGTADGSGSVRMRASCASTATTPRRAQRACG